jgi:hypothetical protein
MEDMCDYCCIACKIEDIKDYIQSCRDNIDEIQDNRNNTLEKLSPLKAEQSNRIISIYEDWISGVVLKIIKKEVKLEKYLVKLETEQCIC